MPKKLMEDMKSGGVRITEIKKEDVMKGVKDPLQVKKPRHINLPKEEKVLDTREIKEEQKIEVRPTKAIREDRRVLSSTPVVRRSKKGLRKSFVFTLGFIVLASVVYFASNYFEKANVNITAKKSSFDLNQMVLDASINKSEPIAFELMIVSNDEYKDLTLTQSQNSSNKAKGEITFFNEYSTKAQTISAKSYVSDPSGKTYQTDKAVTIPGYKTVNSKIVPGQASVGITAFLAGDSYNGSPSDFSINAFKNTPKAKKIYAKLKTPLTGGSQGLVYTLNPTDKGAINAFAQSTFKSNLLKKATAQVPEGYILYPNALDFSYSSEVDSFFTSSNAKVKTSGTVSAIIINRKDLTNTIIKKLIPDISKRELDEVTILNISDLKFAFKDNNQKISKDLKTISFNLTGKIDALWNPNLDILKSSIVGANKKDLVSLFSSDPGIDQASARIFPPWQSFMPKNLEKININLK
jgi:hypothetical protein